MSNEEKNLLGSLLAQNVKRSKIGKIRERFLEIEEAQRKGVRNIDIVNALNAEGYDLTLKTFENMLHRIRKENSEGNNRKSTVKSALAESKTDEEKNKSSVKGFFSQREEKRKVDHDASASLAKFEEKYK